MEYKLGLFLRYALTFSCIISSGTIFYSLNSTLVNVFLTAILLISWVSYNKIVFFKYNYLILLILLFNYLVHIKNISFSTFFTLVLHLLLVQFISSFYNTIDKFNLDYVRILTPFVFISIIGFFVNYFFYDSYTHFNLFQEPKSNQYSSFLFFLRLNDPDNTYRNIAFFWEPGVYSFFLAYYVYALFNIKQISNKRRFSLLFLGFVASLTTFSTAGLIWGIVFLIFYVFKVRLRTTIYWLFFLVLSYLLFFRPSFINYVSELSLSSKARLYDFFIAIQVIKENLVFGLGYASSILNRGENLNYLTDNLGILDLIGLDSMHERGITNGLVLLLGYFGLPMGLIIVYNFFRVFIQSKEFVLCFILIFTLFTQPLFFTPFFILLHSIRRNIRLINESHSRTA